MTHHPKSRTRAGGTLAALWMAAAAAGAAQGPACRSVELNSQQTEVTCSVPPLPQPRPLRFKAHFVGSHDDSVVSLQAPLLNETPVACDAGSKTASRFEDGEVTLECRLLAPASATAARLQVPLALHHLQLERVELAVD